MYIFRSWSSVARSSQIGYASVYFNVVRLHGTQHMFTRSRAEGRVLFLAHRTREVRRLFDFFIALLCIVRCRAILKGSTSGPGDVRKKGLLTIDGDNLRYSGSSKSQFFLEDIFGSREVSHAIELKGTTAEDRFEGQ